jgi:putative oxidoreductase
MNRLVALYERAVDALESLQPAAQLAARLYVAKVFFWSGLTKLRDWEITAAPTLRSA